MTELTFLVDLLLNHKLPKATRDAVAARIKEVENGLSTKDPNVGFLRGNGGGTVAAAAAAIPSHLVGQPASTIAAMMRHEQAGAAPVVPVVPARMELNGQDISAPPTAPVVPVAVVAQTPAAAAAMNARAATINAAVSGKPDKGQTSPRKW